VRAIFANPQTQALLKNVMSQINLAGEPGDLPLEVQRVIVAALIERGIIEVPAPDDDHADTAQDGTADGGDGGPDAAQDDEPTPRATADPERNPGNTQYANKRKCSWWPHRGGRKTSE